MKLTHRQNDRGRQISLVGMVTGRNAPGQLNVNFRLGIGRPPDPFQDMIGPFGEGIGLSQIERRRATVEASQVSFELEGPPP